MRVALVTTSYPRHPGDPAGHFVAAEARARARAGDQVTVFAPAEWGAVEPGNPRIVWLRSGDAFGWPGALARLREAPRRAVGVARFVAAARRAVSGAALDEVVAHWLLPAAWPIAARARGRLEVVCHGTDVELVAALPAFARDRLFASLAGRGARYRCVSADLAARLVAIAPVHVRGAVSVEPARFEVPPGLSREGARARLGVAQGARVVVIVARLIEAKRVAVALRAAALVPGTRVVVLGDGPLRAQLAAAHPAAELRGLVPRDEALEWIAAADVLLAASWREGAPTAVREARALGTTVVASSAGDLAAWAALDGGLSVVSRAGCGARAPR